MNASLAPVAPGLDDGIVATARERAAISGRTIMRELQELSAVPEAELVSRVAGRCGMRVFSTADMLALEPAFDLLPLSKALQRRTVVLKDAAGAIAVLSDAFDADLRVSIESAIRGPVSVALTTEADVLAYLSIQESHARAVHSVLGTEEVADTRASHAEEISYTTATQHDSSRAVKLVNSTLYDAVKSGVSDIHLEATETGLSVRYRIDGMLDDVASINGREIGEQIISRVKVLAELDIAERRIPQDGSFRVRSGQREIDLRVSIMPSVHGEDAVVRILDKQRMIDATGALTLESLGFDEYTLGRARSLLEQPYGMLLVTGPTGSGKTTTLYAALTEINSGHDKIITIEDPVEYQIKGILQIPVNDKKGLTFARGLRSILRHDPDKIMVGEIRDRDTAEIAVQAALTGHMVLTTVHANNIFDVFSRFTHMNIDPYAFSSALNGVWAQRLIRIICADCSEPYRPTPKEIAWLGSAYGEASEPRLYHGRGCGSCRGSGYRGRKAVAELLRLDDDFREMIIERRPAKVLREAARQKGVQTLQEACIAHVLSGETTIEELKRVTIHA